MTYNDTILFERIKGLEMTVINLESQIEYYLELLKEKGIIINPCLDILHKDSAE